MAYSYYQHTMPGWGTNQFQFIPPPAPAFQPQATWGGMDYYRAHAGNADPSLYDHAWRYVMDHRGRGGGGYLGVGMYEARRYHRRAYGSTSLVSMSPEEIGHAAAYEAYRTWIYNSSMHEPLGGDPERQREALIGLAVAEATRLLQSVGRDLDYYGRTTAVDAAASTAANIFDECDDEEEMYRRGRMGYSGSYSAGYDDPYINDDPLHFNRRRSHSVGRRRSYSMLAPPPGMQYAGGSAMSVPGANPMMYGGGYPSYMPSTYPTGGMPMTQYGQPYPSQSLVPAYDPHRHRRSSVSVMQPAMQPAAPVVYTQPISTTSRRSKHRSSHSTSGRSRSSDPVARLEYPGYSSSSRY